MIYRNLIKYHFFSDLSIYFILQAFMFVIIQYHSILRCGRRLIYCSKTFSTPRFGSSNLGVENVLLQYINRLPQRSIIIHFYAPTPAAASIGNSHIFLNFIRGATNIFNYLLIKYILPLEIKNLFLIYFLLQHRKFRLLVLVI